MPLTDARSGDTVLVERVDLSSAATIRLGELGLMPGEELRVLRNQRPCPLVLGLGGAQLMLGRDIGDSISVRSSPLRKGPLQRA